MPLPAGGGVVVPASCCGIPEAEARLSLRDGEGAAGCVAAVVDELVLVVADLAGAAGAAAAALADTVALGRILSICFAESPAFFRSSIEA